MKKALFVIDVQNSFINSFTTKIPNKINEYIEKNKQYYELIIFTNYVNTPESSPYCFLNWKKSMTAPETEIVIELQPMLKHGILIQKHVYSSLKVPRIKTLLKEKKIEEIYLCGIDTDCCILATAYDAFDQGYKVQVLADLCSSQTGKYLHEAALTMLKRNTGQQFK